jgi:hypothetical protein
MDGRSRLVALSGPDWDIFPLNTIVPATDFRIAIRRFSSHIPRVAQNNSAMTVN